MDRSDDERMARHADRGTSGPAGVPDRYLPARVSAALDAVLYIAALSLNRLGRDQGAAIVDRVAGGKSLPLEVRNQILAKTEGIPLFIEELTKTVLESSLLVDEGDHYVLSGPLPSLAIPSTLQDSLMARLDRLSPAKEVAQIGACIGRVFHHRLLAAVTGSDSAKLERALQQLEKSELVYRRGIAPEATYTFACAGAGYRLSEPAQEPQAADARLDSVNAGVAVPRDRRGRA